MYQFDYVMWHISTFFTIIRGMRGGGRGSESYDRNYHKWKCWQLWMTPYSYIVDNEINLQKKGEPLKLCSSPLTSFWKERNNSLINAIVLQLLYTTFYNITFHKQPLCIIAIHSCRIKFQSPFYISSIPSCIKKNIVIPIFKKNSSNYDLIQLFLRGRL